MPTKTPIRKGKLAVVPPKDAPLFPAGQEPSIFKKNRVSKRGKDSYLDAMLLAHIPLGTRDFFAAVLKGVRAGDKNCIELWAKMVGYIKSEGGINVNVNQQNNMVDARNQADSRNFNSIVRQLDSQDRTKMIEASATPMRDEGDDDDSDEEDDE